jgi:uncharacterized protein
VVAITDSLTSSCFRHYQGALVSGYRDNGSCHDIGHAVRVARLAERIAHDERMEATLPVLAALFHDIGHAAAGASGRDDHELRSSEAARQALRIKLSPHELDVVCEAIAGRRFAKRGGPRSATGMVLDDADNLDAIGMTGVARVFLWLGEHPNLWPFPDDPRVLARQPYAAFQKHWDEKLQHLASGMRTATGARLAAARCAQMREFLASLKAEISSDVLAIPDGTHS